MGKLFRNNQKLMLTNRFSFDFISLLQGIITKKDVLRHIKQLKDENNSHSLLFG